MTRPRVVRVVPPVRRPAPAPAAVAAPVPAATPTPTAAAAEPAAVPTPTDNCNPPYYFEGSKKVFKPACL
jgi:serine/threonine-protein kinase